MDMTDFLVALSLAVAIEGCLYALFPDGMKQMMEKILVMPSTSLRSAGLTAACIGVGLVWLIKA